MPVERFENESDMSYTVKSFNENVIQRQKIVHFFNFKT